jgi:tRNA pseudouridine55 synthase
LAARPVTVSRFAIIGSPERRDGVIDLDVAVDCSTGTYVRSLARDLGAALGVGGHLTKLRRTVVGPFDIADAVDVFGGGAAPGSGTPKPPVTEDFASSIAQAVIPATDAVRLAFPTRVVDDTRAVALGHGRSVQAAGIPGTYGVFDRTGALIALVH